MSRILVTGAAGFIGYHVADRLLREGREVVGLDDLNAYYDVSLKEARLARLRDRDGFTFERVDVADRAAVADVFARHAPRWVVHLAAQAGVRYSLENPHAYADANLVGFTNVLEGCRAVPTEHLVYASSSSVYGANTALPFREREPADHPLSLYGATKRANELMAHTYAHLFDLPCSGLRFFTVYGPWGRPDMALFKFTDAILSGRPIDVYNRGLMERDLTYVDDVVEGIVRLLEAPPSGDPAWSGEAPDPARSTAPWRVYNIGNHTPIPLSKLIEVLEEALGQRAEKRLLPMQPGDVRATHADVSDLMERVGFAPSTPIDVGVQRFVAWYREYYQVPRDGATSAASPAR